MSRRGKSIDLTESRSETESRFVVAKCWGRGAWGGMGSDSSMHMGFFLHDGEANVLE